MTFLDVLENLNSEIYEQLKYSLEMGKWPDGEPLSSYHQEIVMQSLIIWGEIHLEEEERIGYVDKDFKGTNDLADETKRISVIDSDSESQY